MNGIIGMSHLALQTSMDDKTRGYIEKIDDSAKNLLEILNDILDFSKIEAGKLEIEKVNFDLYKTINSIKSIFKYKADEKNIRLEILYGDDVKRNYYGDPARLSQVISNLVGNAVKFTNEGTISIVISKSSNNKLKFEIKDTGIGISKEQCDSLFDAFIQADGTITRRFGGTGLGLSISKQLIELMNGKISVESKEGVGSNFFFEIELIEVQYEQNKLDSIEKNSIESYINAFEGQHILLVEDNHINQEILIGLLENSGIDIDITNNGQEAIELFNENKNKYHLILMDLQMPVMDGIEATKIIRSSDNDIPIIALTANAMTQHIEETKHVGMNDHINKPIVVDKLYNTLSKYLKS
jgi:CheY-like chemotaxis protein/two-component sensor histidine kinase